MPSSPAIARKRRHDHSGITSVDQGSVSADRNSEIVLAFYHLAFNEGRPEDGAERYLAENYVQHNPTVGAGKHGVIVFVRALRAKYPEASVTVRRVITDGDMVVTHGVMHLGSDEPDFAVAASGDYEAGASSSIGMSFNLSPRRRAMINRWSEQVVTRVRGGELAGEHRAPGVCDGA